MTVLKIIKLTTILESQPHNLIVTKTIELGTYKTI